MQKQESEQNGSFAATMQKAVTACRKATQKLRRLEQDAGQKQDAWKVFQTELKKKFQAEKRRFEQDMHKLAEEIAGAKTAVAATEDDLKRIANSDGQTSPMPVDSTAEDADWDKFMALDSEDGKDACLERALQASREDAIASRQALQDYLTKATSQAGAPPTPRRPTSQGIATPTRTTQFRAVLSPREAAVVKQMRAQDRRQHTYVAASPNTLPPNTDPYMAVTPAGVPDHQHMTAPVAGVSPGAGSATGRPVTKKAAMPKKSPRVGTSPDGGCGRVPVKMVAKPTNPVHAAGQSMSLAEKQRL